MADALTRVGDVPRPSLAVRLYSQVRKWAHGNVGCRTAQDNKSWLVTLIKRVIHHSTTKSLLDGVVRWLKTGPSPNDAEWQAHTDLVQVCLAEIVDMSESTVNPSKAASSRYVHRLVADKLDRAMPHVRSMLTATREHDRTTALAHGEITL